MQEHAWSMAHIAEIRRDNLDVLSLVEMACTNQTVGLADQTVCW